MGFLNDLFKGETKHFRSGQFVGLGSSQFNSYSSVLSDIRKLAILDKNIDNYIESLHKFRRSVKNKIDLNKLTRLGYNPSSHGSIRTIDKSELLKYLNSSSSLYGIDYFIDTIDEYYSGTYLTFDEIMLELVNPTNKDHRHFNNPIKNFIIDIDNNTLQDSSTNTIYTYTIEFVDSPYSYEKSDYYRILRTTDIIFIDENNTKQTSTKDIVANNFADGVSEPIERSNIGWVGVTLTNSIGDNIVHIINVLDILFEHYEVAPHPIKGTETLSTDSKVKLYDVIYVTDTDGVKHMIKTSDNILNLFYTTTDVSFSQFIQVKSEYGTIDTGNYDSTTRQDVNDLSNYSSYTSLNTYDRNFKCFIPNSTNTGAVLTDEVTSTSISIQEQALNEIGLSFSNLNDLLYNGDIQDLRIGFTIPFNTTDIVGIASIYDTLDSFSSFGRNNFIINNTTKYYTMLLSVFSSDRPQRYNTVNIMVNDANGIHPMLLSYNLNIEKVIVNEPMPYILKEYEVTLKLLDTYIDSFKQQLLDIYTPMFVDITNTEYYTEFRQQEYSSVIPDYSITVYNLILEELSLLSATKTTYTRFGSVGIENRFNSLNLFLSKLNIPKVGSGNYKVSISAFDEIDVINKLTDKVFNGNASQIYKIINIKENTRLGHKYNRQYGYYHDSYYTDNIALDTEFGSVPDGFNNEIVFKEPPPKCREDVYVSEYMFTDLDAACLKAEEEYKVRMNRTNNYYTLMKRIDDYSYEQITISNVTATYSINGFTVTMDSDNIRIPLLFDSFSKNHSSLYLYTLYNLSISGVVFSHKSVYISWYEKDWVSDLINAVAIVFSVVTAGTSLSIVLINMATAIATNIAIEYVSTKIGGKVGAIIGTIASIGAIMYTGDVSNISDMLNSPTLWIKSAESYLQIDRIEAIKEFNKFTNDSQKTIDYFTEQAERYSKLLEQTSSKINPNIFSSEMAGNYAGRDSVDIIDTELYNLFDLRTTIPDSYFEVNYLIDRATSV